MKRLIPLTLITLLASAAAGCGAKTSEPATAGDDDDDDGSGDKQPVASASASVISGSTPLDVQFSGTATGGDGDLEYAWDFGDGETASVKSPSHTFTGAGVFSAVFTATDEDGDFAAATVVITVGNASMPVVSIVATPTNGPAPLNVSLTATASGGNAPLTFAWQYGDGSNGTTPTASHIYQNSGSYLARVKVTDADGDVADATVTIVVGTPQGGGGGGGGNNGAKPDLELFSIDSYESGLEDEYEPNDLRADAYYLGDYGTDGMTYTVSAAYVDPAEVTYTVDVVNYGAAITTPFYVDFYEAPTAAPSSGDIGDQYATVDQMPELTSKRLYFTVENPAAGAKAYSLADSLDDILESDEANNTSLPSESMAAPDEDWYSVYETSGYELSITLDQLPADYDLELYDSSGAKVGGSLKAGTASESILYTVPSTGEYYVRVFGYDGATSSATPYRLTVVVP